MTHPTELTAAQIVHALRLGLPPQHQPGQIQLAEDAYLSWDHSTPGVDLHARPERGVLCQMQAKLPQPPGWITLNLALRDGVFAPGDVLGLVVELDGCAGQSLPLFVRTGRDGTVQDTALQDSLQGASRRTVQTVLHQITPGDALCGSGFHTLVIDLPKQDFTLELRDLRLFVRPDAPHLTRPTLAQA